MTTRNYTISQHVGGAEVILPQGPPTGNNQVLVAALPVGNSPVQTSWQDMSLATGGIPASTGKQQILVSQDSLGNPWAPGDLDIGRY
jgi:hypothetical protein